MKFIDYSAENDIYITKTLIVNSLDYVESQANN